MGWALRLILTGGLALSIAACAGHTPSPTTGHGSYKVGKPYQINGVWYHPREQPNYSEVGMASWYGPGFHGQRTANGEVYNMNDMTAAHTTLPMPTLVRVTNLQNRRSVVVRVNDRGPFARGRIIDLSKRAAEELGFKEQGVARVRVDYLGRADRSVYAQAAPPLPPRNTSKATARLNRAQQERVAATVAEQETTIAGLEERVEPSRAMPTTDTGVATAPAPVARPASIALAQASRPEPIPFQVVAGQGQVYVQLGAYSSPENAIATYSAVAGAGNASIAGIPSGPAMVYRVRLGPMSSQTEAEHLVANLRAQGHENAQIIVE